MSYKNPEMLDWALSIHHVTCEFEKVWNQHINGEKVLINESFIVTCLEQHIYQYKKSLWKTIILMSKSLSRNMKNENLNIHIWPLLE